MLQKWRLPSGSAPKITAGWLRDVSDLSHWRVLSSLPDCVPKGSDFAFCAQPGCISGLRNQQHPPPQALIWEPVGGWVRGGACSAWHLPETQWLILGGGWRSFQHRQKPCVLNASAQWRFLHSSSWTLGCKPQKNSTDGSTAVIDRETGSLHAHSQNRSPAVFLCWQAWALFVSWILEISLEVCRVLRVDCVPWKCPHLHL